MASSNGWGTLAKGIGTLGRAPTLGRPPAPARAKGPNVFANAPVPGINQQAAHGGNAFAGVVGPGINQQAAAAQHPQAQQPAAQPAATSGPVATGPSGNDSLDSLYSANVAANQFKTNNDINALNLQGSQAGTALQSALAQLAYQQPRDQLKLEQGFNNRGGLYSSVYDQNLGNLNYSYLGKQGGEQDKYSGTMDSIAAKIAALQAGIPIYNEQQAAESALRASAAAAKNPAAGEGTGGLNTNPALNGAGPGGSTSPQPPGTILTGTVNYTPPKQQTLAQAIAKRPVVNVKPILGKGLPPSSNSFAGSTGRGRNR